MARQRLVPAGRWRRSAGSRSRACSSPSGLSIALVRDPARCHLRDGRHLDLPRRNLAPLWGAELPPRHAFYQCPWGADRLRRGEPDHARLPRPRSAAGLLYGRLAAGQPDPVRHLHRSTDPRCRCRVKDRSGHRPDIDRVGLRRHHAGRRARPSALYRRPGGRPKAAIGSLAVPRSSRSERHHPSDDPVFGVAFRCPTGSPASRSMIGP